MSRIPSMTTRGVRALVPGIPVYQPPRRNAVRVRVKRHGVWHDITHRVHRGTVRHTNDDPVATLDLTLLNGEGFDSLAPRVKDSPLNRGDLPKWSDIAHLRWSDIAHLRWNELPLADRYSPLLDRYNEIMVEAAISTDGNPPSLWVPIFHGLLGDEIDSEVDADAGLVIRVNARDMAKRLQDDFILEPITFQNMYASQIIQALLDQRFGAGVIQLRVIGQDDYWVEDVTFEYIDTFQALQTFCEQSDKDIRYMLDPGDGQIKLTYWTPDLTMTPVWTIQESDIFRESLRTSDASLRHGVVIRYVDGNGQRQEVRLVDPSLKKPNEPLRIALIEEADTSTIRDATAATRMANAVFNALKTIPATTRLTVPFTPYMKLFDVIEVTNPRLRSEPELYAIEDIEWNFTADDWTVNVTASESVKIRHMVWLEKEAKHGVKDPFTPSDWATQTRPPAPVVTLATGLDELSQASTAWIKATWTRPNWRHIDRYTVRLRRIGSDTYQYQETTELSATFYGLAPRTQYGVQVAVVDGRGVVGPWSTEVVTTSAWDQIAPDAPTGLSAVTGTGRAISLSWTANTDADLAGYRIYRNTTNNFATASQVAELTATRFVDVNVEIGTTYYYWVTAIDRTGNESLPSASVTATPGVVGSGQIDPVLFDIVPSSSPAPSSGNLEDLWDMDPNTGCTFPSAPITITFRYPVYQGSDLVELHLGGASQGYVQMRQRDDDQWINVLGSAASPMQFAQGWNRVPFTGSKLYFGREYRIVLLNNVRVNELRFERVTVADKILAGKLRLTGDMAIEGPDGGWTGTSGGITVRDAGNNERVVVGDLSGRSWRGQPLPQGTYGIYVSKGAGYFAGELDAEIIRSENLDIAFAQVTSVGGSDGNWSIEHVATSKDDWNVLRGQNALRTDTGTSIVLIYHNALSTLIGGLVVEISGNGSSWVDIGQTPYNEMYQRSIAGVSLYFGYVVLIPNHLAFTYRRVVTGSTGADLWIRFRRHAIR